MLAGDEKRIQALFCDLALEDRTLTPRFEKLWRGAEASSSSGAIGRSKWSSVNVALGDVLPRTVRISHLRDLRLASRLSLAVIAITVVLTVFALWARSGEHSQPQRQLAANTSTDSRNERLLLVFTPPKPSSHKVASRRPKRVRARDSVVQKAAAISNWQSPTGILMESPADSVLKSLPQLNESAKELESFLTNNEVKESNR